jgi:metacaspase-1
MAQGISLHIGLNSVDPKQYEGWSGDLVACEFDAKDMATLAAAQGFKDRTILLTKQATAKAVLDRIDAAAKKLVTGDIFFLSNSSHGGQVEDTNGDDKDGMDETWVMYDRMIVDDELYACWAKFKKGVRIIVLSDSCHSGTSIKFVPDFISGKRSRRMPLDANEKTYLAHQKMYDAIQKKYKTRARVKVAASAILISGCLDKQTSLDGDKNGLFTENLKKVWNNGKFTGNHKKFHAQIVAKMPSDQTPNLFKTGVRSAKFDAQKPFTI